MSTSLETYIEQNKAVIGEIEALFLAQGGDDIELGELVIDASADDGAVAANQERYDRDVEDAIADAEETGADIANGSLEERIGFVLRAYGIEEGRQKIMECIGSAPTP